MTTEPIILRPSETSEQETFHLFSIMTPGPGDEELEKKFFVKKEVAPNQTLKAMHIYRTQGPEAAEMYSLEVVLGEEGYAALMECTNLQWEQLQAITEYAGKVVGGRGKGQSGSQPPAAKRGSKK